MAYDPKSDPGSSPPAQTYSSGPTTNTTLGSPNLGNPPSGPATASGGGSSGSGGSTRPATKKSALVALQRYFTNLGLPSSLANWAYGLLKSGYDMEGVMAELYKRPEVRKKYGGIFRKDGSLIVSIPEYIQLSEAYRSLAAQYSFDLSAAQIGKLVNLEVSPEEFKIRAEAVSVVRNNPGVFYELQKQIVNYNQRTGATLAGIKTAADAVNFVLGRADRHVYDLYEGALISTKAKEAGLTIDPVRARLLAFRTGAVASAGDIENRIAQVKKQLTFAGPELFNQGISQQDLEDVQFEGSPNRVRALERVERALASRDARIAASEQTAGSPLDQEGRPAGTGFRRQAGL